MSALSFFNPVFLWGLLFLTIPLLIHLLRRPRVRTLAFSTLRFFHEASVTATRMRRMRSLLLLLMRLLAILALVMLFARPYDPREPLSLLRDPHLTLFTWIDPTQSMGYAAGGITLHERGSRAVDSLREKMAATARHFHFDESFRDFVLMQNDDRSTAEVRHGSCGLDRVMRSWNDHRAVFSLPCLMLISDFQRPTTIMLDSLLERHPPDASLIGLNLAPKNTWNHSLHDARVIDDNATTTVAAHLSSQGRTLDSGRIAVTVSGILAGGGTFSLGSGDTATISVPATNALPARGGTISITAVDPLIFDNTDYFAFEERGHTGVVVLGGQETQFPVSAAFRAMPGSTWDPVAQKSLDETTFDLLDSAGVVVAGSLDRPVRALESFISAPSPGNTVVLAAFADSDEGLAAATSLISRMTRLEAPLRRIELDIPVSPVLPDTLSDLWRAFPHLVTREAAIYRYIAGLPGTPLVRLENGAPLITSLIGMHGRHLVLFATPLGVSGANNLCETGFFVPCLDRVTRHAMRSFLRQDESWIAGIDRRNPFYGSGKAGMVFDAGGAFIGRWQTQPHVRFSQPGLYRIAPEGDHSHWIAIHGDPLESRLEYAVPDVSKRDSRQVIVVHEKLLFETLRGRGRLLSTLPWLLLLLFLLGETLLWEKKRRSDN
ncbi:MAG: BatA domain-containing protein [Chitinispirillaceae bacterium]|nr:BatA domain-containing protein [Chitinispirillaceae bacterium]